MKLFWWGVGITFVYFLILAITIVKLNLDLMASWNEFGDFLAGAFSPVAFLWLVLGFVQQQRELQQNTEALRLQADELKNSVDQYKEMVAIAREQLLADASLIEENKKSREAETKPSIKLNAFTWQSKSGELYTYKITFVSDERDARNVEIEFAKEFGKYKHFRFDVVKKTLYLPEIEMRLVDIPDEVELFVSFESVIGKRYKHRYRCYEMNDGHYKKIEHQELAANS